ncbi:MAG: toxin TcdB middle/N-terminal domain-containing protein [Verrucomicrobiota bacterium]
MNLFNSSCSQDSAPPQAAKIAQGHLSRAATGAGGAVAVALAFWFGILVEAADKSGVSPNAISVPKGPGSIEGLGESFQPTLNTGTAKYSVNLQLPPGVAGHQPKLSLSYEGGGANGPIGYGWNLAVPCIQRRTDKGIPTYGRIPGVNRPDKFINEQREELVPTGDGFYFAENESAFVRYRSIGDHWEATAPDGTRFEFGITPAGRITDQTQTNVFCWLLEKETDTHGNAIAYSYRSFPDEHNLNQKYLALIRFGPGGPAWTSYHFATFDYEDRPDWFEDGRPGFLIRTGKRLKAIAVGTQGVELSGHKGGDFDHDGKTDYLNRRYHLAYLPYSGQASHWSLLSQVQLIGADDSTSLPPVTFDYAVSNPPDHLDISTSVWTSLDEPTVVMDNELVDLIDLNADGLPDVLKTEAGGGAHTAWINRGPAPGNARSIQWAPPVAVDAGTGGAWTVDLASGRTHLADMDGDGLADLVHETADDTVFFYPNRGRVAWGERQQMAQQDAAPPAPFGNAGVRTADVDFDKQTDIIQSINLGSGIAYRVWLNLGNQTYSAPLMVEDKGGFDFSVPGVQIADCNGDRVPDLARVRPGAIEVAAGLGYGRFAAARNLVLPDITLDDAEIAAAKLTDINGDGLADLVLERAAPGECWYWLNLGNYTWSARKVISGLPTVSLESAVRWADLNGNGTTDLIYADGHASSRLLSVDIGQALAGGLAPNTLTRIDNGIGRVTRIGYAPSTQFALADAIAGRPWPDPLPFPVTVVSDITVADSLGHEYVTRFRYHDGFYHPVEKQFRGFADVEQISSGDNTAPTLVNHSRFDTGRNFDAMKGRLLSVSAETEDGGTFSRESTAWADPPRSLYTGTNGVTVRFAFPVSRTNEVLELGRGTPRRLESEWEYDQYGNQTMAANFGMVEGGDRSASNDERITRTEFALNLDRWIVRLPKREEVMDETGKVISRSERFYDDPSFSGANLGAVTIGDLTMRRDWIDPSQATNFVESARTRYDQFGNPVAFLDPLADPGGSTSRGHVRELAYDEPLHTLPVRETIHVGAGSEALVFQAAYDAGFATMKKSTDFNAHDASYEYDPIGRLTSIIKPGDSMEAPTAEFDYALAVTTENGYLVNYVETRRRDQPSQMAKAKAYFVSRQYVDGLGRALMTRTEAEPAEGTTTPRVVVSGASRFNARQQPASTLNPFFAVGTGTLEELLAFENIENTNWRGLFHWNGQLVALDLASAHQSRTDYDATLRPVQTTASDGSFHRTEYEPLVTRIFDEEDTDPRSPHFNTPMVQFTDGLGRLVRTDEVVRLNDDGTRADSVRTWTTRYDYDLNDRLTTITDSQNNVKQLRYDGLRRKISMNDPDSGTSFHRYDAASNLTETTDAKGQRITYTYDGANRILTEDYDDEQSPEFSYHRTPDVAFHYDTPAGGLDQGDGTRAVARNVRGALAWVVDTSGEEHTSFDNRGRAEWRVKRLPDPVLPSSELRSAPLISFRTAYSYDSMDRVIRMVYPDNDQISYEYNERSLMRRIVGGPSGSILSNIVYTPSSQQTQLNYGNGIRTLSSFDERQRLNSLVTGHSFPRSELINLSYTYDAASNVQRIQDRRDVAGLPNTDPRRNSQAFTYDDLYRLTRVEYNVEAAGSARGAIDHQYDRIGNMLAQASDIPAVAKGLPLANLGTMLYGGASGRTGRKGREAKDPPGPHALTAILNPNAEIPRRDCVYDANGNMTVVDGLHCTWDYKDRLVKVEDETMRAEYRYDFANRRVSKRVWPKPAHQASPR